MITNGGCNWHYLAVKSISGLLRGIRSNHNDDFYCLNYFHSYTTENKLRKHKRICENCDFCHLKMPNKSNKTLKYVPGKRSLRVPFIIYADLECLLKKINTCQVTLKNHIHRKKHYTNLQDFLYLHATRLINLKMKENFIEEKTV